MVFRDAQSAVELTLPDRHADAGACLDVDKAKVRLIGKAGRLLDEGLLAGLDMQAGGELAANLHRLYSYCLLRLTQANAQSDAAIVDEVLRVLEPVMDGWNEIGGRARA